MDYTMKNIRKPFAASLLAIAVLSLLAIAPVAADVVYRNISLK